MISTLFIWFIGIFLISIISLYGIFLLIKKFHIKERDVYVILLSFGLVCLGVESIRLGINISNKLSEPKFEVSNEPISVIDYENDSINDSILYNYLKDMRVPHAKIIFAQAKHESENYTSPLFKDNFNMLGMKPPYKRTTTTLNTNRGFQRYCNWREGITDYILWQFTNRMDRLSDEEYLDYLSKCKYAEDPAYLSKLRKTIKSIK